jgi:hypothetical protein
MEQPSQCPISKTISFFKMAKDIICSTLRAAIQGTFFLHEIRFSLSSTNSKKNSVGLNESRESASLGHIASHAPQPTQDEKLIAGRGLFPTTIASVGQITSHLLHSLSLARERTHLLAFSDIKDIELF